MRGRYQHIGKWYLADRYEPRQTPPSTRRQTILTLATNAVTVTFHFHRTRSRYLHLDNISRKTPVSIAAVVSHSFNDPCRFGNQKQNHEG